MFEPLEMGKRCLGWVFSLQQQQQQQAEASMAPPHVPDLDDEKAISKHRAFVTPLHQKHTGIDGTTTNSNLGHEKATDKQCALTRITMSPTQNTRKLLVPPHI
jgi:hypothetical protein